MNKLTAEKCRQFIISMKSEQDRSQLSITDGYQLQALEIALTILEQRERCEGEWIEWGGGECPAQSSLVVSVKHRDDKFISQNRPAGLFSWRHNPWLPGGDIIAYRIIPEQATNQNGQAS